MSQNPNEGPNYNPYGPPSNPSNPNYPPVPGTAYGGPPPSGPNPGYSPYQNPPSGPNAPSGPDMGTPNSSYGPYSQTYAPPPPGPSMPVPPGPTTGGNPYNPYDPTVISQQPISGAGYQQNSGAGYPAYTPPPGPMTVPPPMMMPQPRKSNGKAILIAVIALIIIVGGVLGVVLYSNHQQAVQAQNGTATAQAIVTGTAQANAAATASSQATATAVASHYPFSNNLVLNDALKDDSHVGQYGWDEDSSCSFSAGSYHVVEGTKGDFHLCVANTPTFSNFTFEVQMAIKSGGASAAGGVLFRADTTSDRFYVLFLDTQGNYELDIQANQSGSNSRTLKSGQVPGYASGFFQVHTIGVVANGSQISLYIDQKQLAQVTDTTYTSGQIGVISSYGSSQTEVVYNNAKVWQL